MKRKLMLLLTCLFVGIGLVTAQITKVTGTVISEEDGLPVVGASILVKGTTVGTVTDMDGKFTLSNVPSSAKTLVVSFIGMATQEVAIKQTVNITLKSDAEVLEEVVVTGYGNFKKSSFTGSASNVSTEKLQDIPTVSVQDRLAGSVSGVQITSTSGQPGAVASVRIRGMGSINASNEPLYVIDGVPMLNGDVSEFSYADSGNSLMATLNSNDIESMTVIKDAAAASLYGSRAANGVIVITTKKGASGKTKINLRADWGLSNMAIDYRPILNGEDRREILHLGLANYALNTGNDEAAAKAFADKNIEDFAARPWSGYTDWKDVLFRNGSHQNYEVSAQGGSEKTRFYTSFAYTKQEGITNVSGYERFTGRANVTHQANRLTLEANTMFTNSTQNVNNEGTSFASPIMCYAMTASPSTYPYNEDGSFSTNFPALNGANPVQTEAYNYNRSTINRFLGSLSATWNIWDNLNLKEVISYDFNQNNERVWWDPRSNDGRSSNGVYQRVMGNRAKLNTQTQLTYNKVIAEKHTLDALIGFETEDYKYDYVYANGNTYPSYLPEIENAGNTRASSSVQRYRMTSFLGRLNYDYENKYYFSASFRRDGSSRLSRESRWGDFWSVSGSWRITSESFMENIKEVITDAKLRASYGETGNDNILDSDGDPDYYPYQTLYGLGYKNGSEAGAYFTVIANPSLKWETQISTDIALEFGLFDRLTGTIEYFKKDSKDLLFDVSQPASVGVTSIIQNIGKVTNSGVEIELDYNAFKNKDWSVSVGANATFVKNKIKNLPATMKENGYISGSKKWLEGKSIYEFWLRQWHGVDPQTGDGLYVADVSKYNQGNIGTGDGNITQSQFDEYKKTVVTIDGKELTNSYTYAKYDFSGSSIPDVYGGFNVRVSYKNFDLAAVFSYQLGGQILDTNYATMMSMTEFGYAQSPDLLKAWKQAGDITEVPRIDNSAAHTTNIGQSYSTRWLTSSDYLNLRSVTIGYQLPKTWLSKVMLKSARLNLTAENLFMLKARQGLNPMANYSGVTYNEYMPSRNITLGLNVSF